MALDKTPSRHVAPEVYTRLKTWAARKPCVALMGEFSAGKSTLLNFLIEADLLPTRVTATELPPIWFSHGRDGSHWVDQDGARHPIAAADLNKVPIAARYARIYIEAEILEACDVIDTPGISDPNLAAESWQVAAGFANMVLWCTTATQAWRETERSTWLSMPERLRQNSLLIVTRSDKLTTAVDRDKVARRLQREAGGLFSDIVFISSMDAVKAKIQLEAGAETTLWADSGAEKLLDALAMRFESIGEHRHALFARYSVAKSDRAHLLRLEHAGAEDGYVTPTRPTRVARPDGPTRPERGAAPLRLAPQTSDEAAAGIADEQPVADSHVNGTAVPNALGPSANGIEIADRFAQAQTDVDPAPEQAVRRSAGAGTETGIVTPEPDGVTTDAVSALPAEVAIWREIVADAAAAPSGTQLVSMIEQLLFRLYGKPAIAPADRPENTQPVAQAEPQDGAAATKVNVTAAPAKGWRRLA